MKGSGLALNLTEKSRRSIAFYLMISPWFVVFVLFSLYPLFYGLYLSFTNYIGLNLQTARWVGLQNYKNVFTDSDALYALGRTVMLTAVYVPISTLVGLLLAVLLNQNVRGVGIYRTIFYLPSIVPLVSAALMWKMMYANQTGILNVALKPLGMPSVNWLSYDYATMSLIITLIWASGSGILINLAGLKGISKELYEAASIDGAPALSRFVRITLPMMSPILFFNVIMGIIHTLQLYILPILLSGNDLLMAPIRPNYVYVVHAFQQVFAFQRFAYGMALLWVLFTVILLMTLVVFRSSRYWVHYEMEQEE
ncbi:carbohydrate ABC transporter permease [Paenibacillus roseipurpureus]|uniref:Sugar ABC transporter permease n=1 Tax=Paenibacillus roseopurpureus TaxID=2918901 RepID=A0AA96LP70_9BACL|nr:sugar ABC transporter permease [Paenibacillus sp. MBLB1832]WNR45677.1 sugar ABC transporter permease [Paenibacillus sp. MBLB1832]